MSNSLSHTSSSDSEQGGSSSGRESQFELSSIMEGGPNGFDGGTGPNVVQVAPVARQTTLVLQGYFTEEARINNPDVSEHFSRLQGAGMTAADDEALFQLGLEMNRASLQLREKYSTEFEEMMGDLGTSPNEIFQALSEIAARLFHNPTEISWSRILTFFSFAAWVLIKKGFGFVGRALKQAQDLLSMLTSMLGDFKVFSWISRMGGWTANKSHLTNEAELQKDENDGAISTILQHPPLHTSLSRPSGEEPHPSGLTITPYDMTDHNPSGNAQPNGGGTSSNPNATTGSSYWSLGGAVGTAAIAVGVVAFFAYKKLK